MKIKWQSLIVTLILLLVLYLTLLGGVGLFISGPKYANVKQDQKIVEVIQTKYPNISILNRHVFRYVVYVGEGEGTYYFFNEKGEQISSRQQNQQNEKKALLKMQKEYQLLDCELQLGYGIDGPVYSAETGQGMVLLDFDTLEEVYYLKKGEL